MRFALRDVVSFLGFVSLASSLFSVATPLASAPPPHALPPSTPVSSDGMSGGMKPPSALNLNLDGRDIVTIYSDGKVHLADGLTPDEASQQFWRKVGELAPSFCRTRAAQN
jgi:hypothetical protein